MNCFRDEAVVELFRGRLAECVEHFAQCFNAHFPKGIKGTEAARKPMADFCQVDVGTTKNWLDGSSTYHGISKVRLMCYLEMLGYHVLEMDQFQTRREFVELLGYGVVTPEQAAAALGYSDAAKVVRILRPGEGIGDEKELRMFALCREKREELAQKKEFSRQNFRLEFPLVPSVEKKKVSAVLSIMEGLLSLLESNEIGLPFIANLHNLSPQDRSTVLKLADVVSVLPSKMIQGERGEGGNE